MDRYKKTFETWDKLASLYQDKFMDLDLYNDTYDQFCTLIEKQHAAIFEIGCGPGNVTRQLIIRRPDFKITAIDVAPSMVALAKENNPAAHFEVMDCREIDKIEETFDGIMCGFCMPYLSKDDCRKLIQDCSGLLASSGILYLSVIEDEYSKSDFETSSDGQHTVFVYYHEEGYLQEMWTDSGFETVDVIRKHYEKADGTPSTHMIIIARKK